MTAHAYTDKDMVQYNIPGQGVVSVPKRWEGTDLLRTDAKRVTAKEAKKAAAAQEEPSRGASREAWVAFATQGPAKAKSEDLVGDDGKDLTRDQLADKFGTPKGE